MHTHRFTLVSALPRALVPQAPRRLVTWVVMDWPRWLALVAAAGTYFGLRYRMADNALTRRGHP